MCPPHVHKLSKHHHIEMSSSFTPNSKLKLEVLILHSVLNGIKMFRKSYILGIKVEIRF